MEQPPPIDRHQSTHEPGPPWSWSAWHDRVVASGRPHARQAALTVNAGSGGAGCGDGEDEIEHVNAPAETNTATAITTIDRVFSMSVTMRLPPSGAARLPPSGAASARGPTRPAPSWGRGRAPPGLTR